MSGLREVQEQGAPGRQQAQPGLQRSECRHGARTPPPGRAGGAPTAHTACVRPAVGRGALCMVAGKSPSKQHFTEREPLFYVPSEIDI